MKIIFFKKLPVTSIQLCFRTRISFKNLPGYSQSLYWLGWGGGNSRILYSNICLKLFHLVTRTQFFLRNHSSLYQLCNRFKSERSIYHSLNNCSVTCMCFKLILNHQLWFWTYTKECHLPIWKNDKSDLNQNILYLGDSSPFQM